MKAMNMVAASKLQKSKAKLNISRPLFEESERIINMLRVCGNTSENIFIKPRPVKSAAYVVISSNRGLCGGYNTNVASTAFNHIKEHGVDTQILAFGSKGRDYLKRRGEEILRSYPNISESGYYVSAEMIGSELISMYLSGKVDAVYVAYTYFESALSYVPKIAQILPLYKEPYNGEERRSGKERRVGEDRRNTEDTFKGEERRKHELHCNGDRRKGKDRRCSTSDSMQYEPDVEHFMESAVPLYVNAFIYDAMLESDSSEQASRMISMDAATKNATEIIDDLTLMFNRIRQSHITQEINEIVSGANATK
jgi:F-type H+-transporting ATPase subunit gamma